MDSFDQTTIFRYNPNAETEDDDSEFSGVLEIYVHHARNIHNICIYDNQDVYAKFSLTYNPDETFSTRIINGGGKNPVFNENLAMKISQFDSVLKCEMWMFSRARVCMDDQLLGFALVPISSICSKGKSTQDFSLSSTDLFHSPAGTVRLTLCLNTNSPGNPSVKPGQNTSISSEVIFLDRKGSGSDPDLDLVEYSRIEFPDIGVVRENEQMVSEYFDGCNGSRVGLTGPGSFLCLGASLEDYEMAGNSSGGSVSPNESGQNSGFLSSTMTSLSDDRNSADSMEKKNEGNDSVKGSEILVEKEAISKEDCSNEGKTGFLPNMNIAVEQSAMQQQIVDMYMRSMQQFTESLAKMKLPMDLDKPESLNGSDVIQNRAKVEGEKTKKDGARVFYGSRAFF
jgi:hypothetical protein